MSSFAFRFRCTSSKMQGDLLTTTEGPLNSKCSFERCGRLFDLVRINNLDMLHATSFHDILNLDEFRWSPHPIKGCSRVWLMTGHRRRPIIKDRDDHIMVMMHRIDNWWDP